MVKEKLPHCAVTFTNRPSLRLPTFDRFPPADGRARFSPVYSCESTDESSPWYGYVSEPRGGDTISNCDTSKLERLENDSIDGRE